MLRLAYESLAAGVLFCAAALALAAVRRDPGRLSLVAGIGTLFLAVDEVLDLHERLGTWVYEDLQWDDPPLVNHWDDIIVMAIGLAGLVVIGFLRTEVVAFPPFARWFAAGLALFAFAVVWDGRATPATSISWYTEESTELAAAACMTVAFAVRFRWLGDRGRATARLSRERTESEV